ncbi:hypothetical protein EDD18DRAFT_1357815 [Armillaria luteobubalina]|uniref:Uncharacterized protein n=1 Tax=Armillaria luteobubalina TaxID=153913 RepID=A0AA39PYU7_9AGAR|nr:hypothetical protein EDD18DRAFT_1357810 [Armillaria luteobubalina]KAK0492548.1 hypothetical protein EDD18DRAFT_1357815 [Armillaria luteobubalina]
MLYSVTPHLRTIQMHYGEPIIRKAVPLTPDLAHYSTYSQSEIIPTANLMLNYILMPIRHEQFYKNFTRKQNMKASVYIRTWALQRWNEGSQVELQQELPALKAEIRQQRAMDGLAKEEAVVNAHLLARKA